MKLTTTTPKEIALTGRIRAKVTSVIIEVNQKIRTVFVELDLAHLSSVRSAAETIDGCNRPLVQ